MPHLILLGDSIFDNARYVPGRPAVIEQVRQVLPAGWRATLLAVDGHVTEDVARQLKGLPADASHLFVSVGGNDALGESSILGEPAATVGDALELLNEIRNRFTAEYRDMLQAVAAVGKTATVCTVYDAIPGLGPGERTALALFNEVILREAVAARIPVIDLRLLCGNHGDYSHLSPIEPSAVGGAKIARVIAQVATTHDFAFDQSILYW